MTLPTVIVNAAEQGDPCRPDLEPIFAQTAAHAATGSGRKFSPPQFHRNWPTAVTEPNYGASDRAPAARKASKPGRHISISQ